ncbi:MAG: hypothetical protein JAZ03_22070 [Candidatus Thiodiazotropha taylori]|nr:hypothetical protein [Candidatus Thiodiazotropha taylori]MCW4259919.1 hypothetical protein [Candidatus Thiodiazotropha endolucinida]MCG8034839.1 hypothetical protein [Candidatus Thiodiazotropha taylori]MCG8048710.1 hypothetical protein [Candidatus Thiodiazotropha taylori]MCW4336615.1 hypothetical protein [Candidatus Thiodiazotropha endolucinida]
MASEDSEAAFSESLLVNSKPDAENRAEDKSTVLPIATSDWRWCGARVPKNQVTYMTQVVLVYSIIAVSLSQLILQSSDRELWLILLSTSVGYVLPSPSLKFLKPKLFVTSAAATATLSSSTTAVSSSFAQPCSTEKADCVSTETELGNSTGE